MVLIAFVACTAHQGAQRGRINPSPTPSAVSSPPTATASPQGSSELIIGVALVTRMQGWVLTNRRLLHTVDAGTTWRGVSISGLAPYPVPAGQFFVDGPTAWVVSAGSRVRVTKVSGPALTVRSSTIPNIGPGVIVSASLSLLTSSRGFVAVAHGADSNSGPSSSDLYRTTDGGRSWDLVARKTPVLRAIHFASPSIGWALQRPLLRTVNGGRTWHAQPVPVHFDPSLGGDFDALSLFGSNGVLEARVPTGMLGHPVYVLTHDGGRTWHARGSQSTDDSGLEYANTGPPLSFSAVDSQHWRASVYDHVVATDDTGLHWREVATNLSWRAIQGLSFATPDAGWAFSYLDSEACVPSSCSSRLEATDDGGRTWHQVRLPI